MSTKSITKNIIISDKNEAEQFVDTLEQAEKVADELLPCPFCGSEGILQDRYLSGVANRKNYWVFCSKCQARIQDRRSMKKAREAWNKRV